MGIYTVMTILILSGKLDNVTISCNEINKYDSNVTEKMIDARKQCLQGKQTNDCVARNDRSSVEKIFTTCHTSLQMKEDGKSDFESPEDSNYLRFCHLIQKVAPQAVRHKFDEVFPPADLEGIIQKNMVVLKDLHRRRIKTHPQWKLICSSGSKPLSSTFDVTTMVCLFQYLANIAPQSGLHDTLPPLSDTSLGADLARIKYFRNRIAHHFEKDRIVDNREFPMVWDTASKAVSRIGGKLYEQECSSLRIANLDSSYLNIYRDLIIMEMQFKQQIADLKKVKKKLETQHAQVKKLEIQQKDPLPPNKREYVEFLITNWESREDKFVETSAAKYLSTIMKTENVAIVTGSPGTGKSFTVQNVLLSMRAEGYAVIPVRSSSDLVRYFSGSSRQVFYLDNLCGIHNISNSDVEEWCRNNERLVDIFTNALTKCILECRLQIFLDSNFRNLHLEKYKVINLSGDHQLTLKEKHSVGQIHIGQGIIEQLTDEIIVKCVCFPLLCSLYEKTQNIAQFFKKPKTYFESKLTELRNSPHKVKYACIALCVMFNDNEDFDVLTRTNEEDSQMITSVFEELEINVPPIKAMQSSFESMVGPFFKKTYRGYRSIHDYMFDIYCVHISKTMINILILYADSKLISERALLHSLGEVDEFAILICEELENDFFKRILKDLYLSRVSDVFRSSQMKYKSYRTKFISLLRGHDFDINFIDICGNTPLYIASDAGHDDVVEFLIDKGADVKQSEDFSLKPLTAASGGGHIHVVELLCKLGADVNQFGKYGSTPLIAASGGGHIHVVELLCNNGAHVNQIGWSKQTPLIAASGGGHINVVKLLCNKGADVNQFAKYGSTPLTAASFEGHINVVELLCKKDADVNQCDGDGSTPLTAASEGGHINVVDLLCSKGADVNKGGKCGSTPLTAASERGHINVVDLLCSKRADVNKGGKCGSTPLTAASERGHINVVDLLCSKGADVNKGGKCGSTPLTAASERGHINVVELLCNKGLDVNQCNGDGSTPLTAASKGGHINVVELLCNKGADVNQCIRNGPTPLTEASRTGHINVVELLCYKGADVNQCGKYESTPLTEALEGGHIDVVELLCNKGADVNQCDKYGCTPLTAASKRGFKNVVELLCSKGADVNKGGKCGWTPLTVASRGGHINVVELLCNKGADVNHWDGNGPTPLTGASREGHINVVELLCNKGADVNQCGIYGSTPLTAASFEGHINVVELLCNKDADVNQCDGYGSTPLTTALEGGYMDVVELLCNKGADVNQCDGGGSTPLTAASEGGHINVVELLCNKGADVNQCDGDGSTPLTAASEGGYMDVVQLLCNKGADVNQCDGDGSTPLTAASEGGYMDVVQLLYNKGADVNQCDGDGSTPLTVASEGGYMDVVQLLCNKGADVHQCDKYGKTPLSIALLMEHVHIVEMLRQFEANKKLLS